MIGGYYTMTGGMHNNMVSIIMTNGILREIQTDGAGGGSTTIIIMFMFGESMI